MTEQLYGTPEAPVAEAPAKTKATHAKKSSPFDLLKESAAETITNVVTFPIKHRKGDLFAEFNAVIDEDDIKKYRARAMAAAKSKKPEDMKMSVANGMALVEKNVAILTGGPRDDGGTEILDSEGDPLVFGADEFTALYPDKATAVEVLKEFLGNAQLTVMGEALYKAAGYGEDLEPINPTNG